MKNVRLVNFVKASLKNAIAEEIMKRRQAFTLVELLVVIGIIALLISVLLPALNRARASAKRVECAAYLRQIGVATINYCNDNKGYLPPYRFDRGLPSFDLSNSFAYIYSLEYGVPPLPDAGALIRRMVHKKYLSSQEQSDSYSSRFWRIEKCPSALDVGDPSRAYYFFNPHMAMYSYNGGYVLQPWWKKIKNHGKAPHGFVSAYRLAGTSAAGPVSAYTFDRYPRALAVDPINGLDRATHMNGKERAWNMLFADGSVKMTKYDQRVHRDSGNWPRMLDLLGFLESTADGGKANISDVSIWNNKFVMMPVDPK